MTTASMYNGTMVVPVQQHLHYDVSGFKIYNKRIINQWQQCQKPVQARQHGTMAMASPSWHNSSSVAAAHTVHPVMVSQEFS